MFTGIVEETGIVTKIVRGAKSVKLTVKAKMIFDDLKIGDSVSTNGVCLTVTEINDDKYSADVMNETLNRSSLSKLNVGGHVNLERAMHINSRFGGHIVSGHIDGVGTIDNIRKDDIAYLYTIKATSKILDYIVEKGSVALDGISLTVVSVSTNSFVVSVIPHTANETNLSKKSIGDVVNIENDVIGKYIEKFTKKTEITKEFLISNGF